jgi:hypothetical protein
MKGSGCMVLQNCNAQLCKTPHIHFIYLTKKVKLPVIIFKTDGRTLKTPTSSNAENQKILKLSDIAK